MFARKRERMEAEARDAETAKRIAALREEGYRLWVEGEARQKQSLFAMIAVFILTFVYIYLPSQFPSWPVMILWVATFLIALMLYGSGVRLRWKAENIDIEMRRLNPEARLLSSVPEEIGLSIRAALDKRPR